jgi:quercetin dioxygenase-like cupin family protein
MKYTAKADRAYVDSVVIGHPIPRCTLWDGGHGVHTSIVQMYTGMDLGVHKHETWVQVFVLSGKIYCSRGKITCGPGDFYFVEPNESHLETCIEAGEIMITKAMPNVQYPIGAQGKAKIDGAIEATKL